MSKQIKEIKPMILPQKQDFYLKAELFEDNFITTGIPYRTKEEAENSISCTDSKSIILKFTLTTEDFE